MKNNLLNEQCKKTWFENNYFWACTLGFIALNFVMYAIVGAGARFNIPINDNWNWHNTFNFNAMLVSFLNSFGHFDFLHISLNMVCLLIVGAYLERKIGSIKLTLLILASAFFTSIAVTANNLSSSWLGFSGVMYALYAYVIIDYIFLCCSKQKRNKLNLWLGGVLLIGIYIAMCYNSATDGFNAYPVGLSNNLGHYSSFVAGIILTLVIKVAQIKPKEKE